MSARLIRLNRSAAGRAHRGIIAAVGYGVMLALLWAGRESLVQAIDWLRPHSLVWGGLAALAAATQVARRRVLKRAEFARSWLAAVPIKSRTATFEALIIETLPATVALALLSAVGLACGLVLVATQAGHGASLMAIIATLSGGIAIGAIVSYAIPAPKPLYLPPGSRYVPHQKSNRAAKLRPSLAALGSWPVRQMFAWAQPKMVARATLPILIMMPLGTRADQAMGVIAVLGVSGALLLLWAATTSIGRQVRRWTAPLPLRAGAVMRAYLLPTFGVMLGSGIVESLLLLTFDVSFRRAAVIGIITAVIGCLATFSSAWLWLAVPERRP
jgi:hypothetical protein